MYQLTKFGDSMSCDLKDIFKYAPCPILVMTLQIW